MVIVDRLTGHVAFGLLPVPYKLILQRGSFCGSDSTKSLRKVLKSSSWPRHLYYVALTEDDSFGSALARNNKAPPKSKVSAT
jgi:hypothetical protein